MEDELDTLRTDNIDIQKETEKLHELLEALENPDKSERDLKKDIKELEDEMSEMQDEWNAHRNKVLSKIEKYKTTIDENKVSEGVYFVILW